MKKHDGKGCEKRTEAWREGTEVVVVFDGKRGGQRGALGLHGRDRKRVEDGGMTGRDRRPQYMNGSDNGAQPQMLSPGATDDLLNLGLGSHNSRLAFFLVYTGWSKSRLARRSV